jgi:hypothetical protein
MAGTSQQAVIVRIVFGDSSMKEKILTVLPFKGKRGTMVFIMPSKSMVLISIYCFKNLCQQLQW